MCSVDDGGAMLSLVTEGTQWYACLELTITFFVLTKRFVKVVYVRGTAYTAEAVKLIDSSSPVAMPFSANTRTVRPTFPINVLVRH